MRLLLPVLLGSCLASSLAAAFMTPPRQLHRGVAARRVAGNGARALSMSKAPPSQSPDAKETIAEVVNTFKDYVVKGVESVKDLDPDKAQNSLTDWGKAVNDNTIGELDLTMPGELWAIPPLVVFGLILYGQLPLFGGILQALAGPGLMLIGGIFLLAGLYELGANLSPWPQPVKNSTLKTEGVYGLVRHPMYGGLVIFSFGLSVATEEFERLVLTLILIALFEKKVEYEEAYLRKKFEGYAAYSQTVKKFIPFVY